MLIFLDPPYLLDNGNPDPKYGKPYFTLKKMEDLLKRTAGSKAKYIFFHYENDIVEALLRKYGFEYQYSYKLPLEKKVTVVYTKNISSDIQLFDLYNDVVYIDTSKKEANS